MRLCGPVSNSHRLTSTFFLKQASPFEHHPLKKSLCLPPPWFYFLSLPSPRLRLCGPRVALRGDQPAPPEVRRRAGCSSGVGLLGAQRRRPQVQDARRGGPHRHQGARARQPHREQTRRLNRWFWFEGRPNDLTNGFGPRDDFRDGFGPKDQYWLNGRELCSWAGF